MPEPYSPGVKPTSPPDPDTKDGDTGQPPVNQPPSYLDQLPPPGTPRESLTPMSCPWAQDGLRRALDGAMGPSSGVDSYKIGSRDLRYRTPADHARAIDYWSQMCVVCCPGFVPLPTSITGRNTARRGLIRDI